MIGTLSTFYILHFIYVTLEYIGGGGVELTDIFITFLIERGWATPNDYDKSLLHRWNGGVLHSFDYVMSRFVYNLEILSSQCLSTGRQALVYNNNKIRMFVCLSVCLFVCILLCFDLIYKDILYMVGSGILLGRYTSNWKSVRATVWASRGEMGV